MFWRPITLALLLVGSPGVALAQAVLDRAERQLEEAQFEEAADTLAEATASEAGLNREAVARLLRLRAVVGSALGRERAVRRDLLALASVLDGREPGPLPPGLARQLNRARSQVRGTPSVSVRIESEPSLRAVMRVHDDPGDLARETELVCESGGEEVARADATELDLPALQLDEQELVCTARAIGPGGWVVDTATARRAGSLGSVELGPGDPEPEPLWPWILGGVGGAVVIGIIIGIIAGATASRGVGGPEWTP